MTALEGDLGLVQPRSPPLIDASSLPCSFDQERRPKLRSKASSELFVHQSPVHGSEAREKSWVPRSIKEDLATPVLNGLAPRSDEPVSRARSGLLAHKTQGRSCRAMCSCRERLR